MADIGVSSIQGVRESQQDAAIAFQCRAVTKLLQIGMVSDGAGGMQAGDEASRVGMSAALQALFYGLVDIEQHARHLTSDALGDLLGSALVSANDAVNGRIAESAHAMAATLTIMVVCDGRIHVAWAGDSPAYCFRKSHPITLTLDHTLAEAQVREGLIARGDVEYRRTSHIINNYLGQPPTRFRYDLRVLPSEPGDVLVIASDGVDPHPSHIDVADAVRIGQLEARTAAHLLTDKAVARGSTDNASAVVLVPDAPTSTPSSMPTVTAGYPTELAFASFFHPLETTP